MARHPLFPREAAMDAFFARVATLRPDEVAALAAAWQERRGVEFHVAMARAFTAARRRKRQAALERAATMGGLALLAAPAATALAGDVRRDASEAVRHGAMAVMMADLVDAETLAPLGRAMRAIDAADGSAAG